MKQDLIGLEYSYYVIIHVKTNISWDKKKESI